MPRDWNATSYEQVSAPLEAMGRDVLDRLELHGDERVLDAGCGTGRVTAALVERLPRGRSWPSTARRRWSSRRASGWATAPTCPSPTCSSSSVDPPATRSSRPRRSTGSPTTTGCSPLLNALTPGGRLAAQCGGAGNVAGRPAARRHGRRTPGLGRLARAVELPSPADTEARLQRLGWSTCGRGRSPSSSTPEDPREYFGTVMLGSHLERLDPGDRDAFVGRGAGRAGRARRRVRPPQHPGPPRLHRLGGLCPSARSSAISSNDPDAAKLAARGRRARSSRSRCAPFLIAALADRDVRRPTVVVAGDDRAARDLAADLRAWLRPAAGPLLPEPRRRLRVAPRAAAAPRRAAGRRARRAARQASPAEEAPVVVVSRRRAVREGPRPRAAPARLRARGRRAARPRRDRRRARRRRLRARRPGRGPRPVRGPRRPARHLPRDRGARGPRRAVRRRDRVAALVLHLHPALARRGAAGRDRARRRARRPSTASWRRSPRSRTRRAAPTSPSCCRSTASASCSSCSPSTPTS